MLQLEDISDDSLIMGHLNPLLAYNFYGLH